MHLVLGANHAFGGAMVRALRARGAPVRVLLDVDARLPEGVEVVRGDARHLPTLVDAAKGCESLTHGYELPPHLWQPGLLEITEHVVEASGLSGATVVLPNPIHGLKPIYAVPLPPDAPKLDVNDRPNPLGNVRNMMEDHLSQNAELRNVRTIVVRHGDLYGPGVADPIVAPMFRAALAGAPIPWLGSSDTAHAFTFVEDVATVATELLFAPDRPVWDVVSIAGDSFLSAEEWAAALGKAVGKPVSVRSVPFWLVQLKALWDRDARAMLQVLYQWEAALLLDDTRLRRVLPEWSPTPVEDALARTFAWYREGR